ncbi:hypothetical protein ONS95_009078 [Cadophora gregata]|uniref:uncharacterized protein n=1 Tax=Cadophora gregata TaxID=51156 RepID=UPI0026DB73E9|nr:uncharacterized protein ONS95_009078 [Cadophora gregata]KAK0124095.1 hypothetical protein ONS95_009078 [Cadophora gregata]
MNSPEKFISNSSRRRCAKGGELTDDLSNTDGTDSQSPSQTSSPSVQTSSGSPQPGQNIEALGPGDVFHAAQALRRQFPDEEPPEFRSRAGSLSSLPSYTDDERPPYPHDHQVNDDWIVLMMWLISDWRESAIARRMPPIQPGDDVAMIRRRAEVEVDNWFEIEGIVRPRQQARVELAGYNGEWTQWLGSVRRLNQLHRRRRENGHQETEEESEGEVDLDFRIAFGRRPPGLLATAPVRAETEVWEKWLESEERWPYGVFHADNVCKLSAFCLHS